MVVCQTEDDLNCLRGLRAHGWTRHLTNSAEVEVAHPTIDPRFLFVNVGYNLRPLEVQGAMLSVQLTKLHAFNECRRKHGPHPGRPDKGCPVCGCHGPGPCRARHRSSLVWLDPIKSPVQAGEYTWLHWAIRRGVANDDEGLSLVGSIKSFCVKLYATSPIKSERATVARRRYSTACRPTLDGRASSSWASVEKLLGTPSGADLVGPGPAWRPPGCGAGRGGRPGVESKWTAAPPNPGSTCRRCRRWPQTRCCRRGEAGRRWSGNARECGRTGCAGRPARRW